MNENNRIIQIIRDEIKNKIDKQTGKVTQLDGNYNFHSGDIFQEIVNSISFNENDNLEGISNEKGLFDAVYQLFGTNETTIFPYLACVFNEENKLDKLRLFNTLPTKEQLKEIAEETYNKDTYCIIPLAFETHWATGICIKGNFFIFDSTRQLSDNSEQEILINGHSFNVLNHKKYQSELTGTCGFWTALLCTKLASIDSSDLPKQIKKSNFEEILKDISKKIICLTERIINQNKVKINDIAVKNFNIKINFEKIIADAKNACEGIQLSKDSSKYLHNYSDVIKPDKKRKPIVDNINYDIPKPTKQQTKQKTETLYKNNKNKKNFYKKNK